jgi:hypothetical protein
MTPEMEALRALNFTMLDDFERSEAIRALKFTIEYAQRLVAELEGAGCINTNLASRMAADATTASQRVYALAAVVRTAELLT